MTWAPGKCDRLRDQELLTRSAQKSATPRASPTEARKKVWVILPARNSLEGLERLAESPASKLPGVKSLSPPRSANRQELRSINPSRHPQSLLQRLAVAARAASRGMVQGLKRKRQNHRHCRRQSHLRSHRPSHRRSLRSPLQPLGRSVSGFSWVNLRKMKSPAMR